MKWMELTVAFDDPRPGPAAIELTADIFTDLGAQGVVIEDPDEQPGEPWAPEAERRPDRWAVIGYLPANRRLEGRLEQFSNRVAELQARENIRCRIDRRQIDEQDWAESWKAYFWPEKVGHRLVVKPTWRSYDPGDDEIVLEIDPGMAFGTGTHPTTSMCMELMEKWLRPGDAMLDVGTGSGILMVAAALLGAGRVTGVDSDEVATSVAVQNLRLNRVPEIVYQVVNGSLAAGVAASYDLVVANILTPVILELIPDVPRVLHPGGVLICSGIIAEKREQVRIALWAHGFKVLDDRQRDDWIAIAARYGA